MKALLTRLLCGAAILLLAPGLVFAQDGTLSGTVTDGDTGDPLPGATVQISEIGVGSATDVDGNFEFEVPAGEHVVTTSFVGYSSQEKTVTVNAGETTVLDFVLLSRAEALDELVVEGLRPQRRRNVSGSIAEVKTAEIQDAPILSTEQALQGRAAGVVVQSASGLPGGGFNVRVRGATSINGSNQPLYVVDGVPVADGDFVNSFTGSQSVTNALSTLNLEDVESIEILKDASAAALYGSRAANGVVLITTKTGKAGATNVNFNSSIGVSSTTEDYSFLTGPEYVRLRNEGVVNEFGSDFAGFFGDPAEQETFDYFDAISQQALVQRFGLSVSGGTGETRYFVSGNILNEEAAIIEQGYQRLSGRVNVDHRWNDGRGTVSVKSAYSQGQSKVQDNDNSIFGLMTNALTSPTNLPIESEDGPEGLNEAAGFFDNPLLASQITNTVDQTKFLGSLEVGYEFVEGLNTSVRLGIDRFDQAEDFFAPGYTVQGGRQNTQTGFILGPREGENDRFLYTNYILSARANYSTLINDVHDLTLTGFGSVEQTARNRVEATGQQFPNNNLQLASLAAVRDGFAEATSSGLQSVLGAGDYAYDRRYLLSVVVRADGSSRFGSNNRWGVFPAFSLGWNAHEESFINYDWLNQFKLRGSLGFTGQQEIGNFSPLAQSTSGDYNAQAGTQPLTLPNPDLQWEETRQINVGFDFSVVNSRLSGTFDIYQKDTDKVLLESPIPGQSGFTLVDDNVGKIRNQGVELSLTSINVRTDDFSWETNFNISSNETTVEELPISGERLSFGFGSIVEEGEILGAFRGYVTDGFFQSQGEIDNLNAASPTGIYQRSGTAPGDFRFVDLNGDGQITADDQEVIGDPSPDAFGGLTNTFRYKGLTLSAFVQYSIGNDVFNASRQFTDDVGGFSGTSARLLDRWTPENTNAANPRATNSDPNDNDRDSDFYVEDGSYVRLKSVRLSYSLPSDLIGRAGFRNARIFATGRNLLTFTGYDGLDPEVNYAGTANITQGTDFFTVPQTRAYVIGVELGF